ncbi:hypothetical protein [uncultured Psychrobacter sp.]|uniref:hypothetical protein n=1 Tax=uncultured Psychrobacter sp. TaxID=259303 RepID=UPI0026172BB7|nr:hypothetical protein [uncultured Psychrobacter sp.]
MGLTTLLVAIIGTFFAIIGTFFSGMSYINEKKQSNEKLNEKVKKSFLRKIEWTNEGDVDGDDTVFFNMSIENPESYRFYGKISYYEDGIGVRELVFYFDKIKNKNIYLTIRKTNGYKEQSICKAKLKFINDDLFQIKFYKFCNHHHDIFIPKLPQKTIIFPDPTYDSKLILTDDIINEISPGRNYAKVSEILGVSDTTGPDYSIFGENTYETENKALTSDLFFLRNALLKVSTLDKISIYSITVFPYDRKITLPRLFYPCNYHNNIVGEAHVCKEIIEHATLIEPITTVRDRATAIQNYTGAPFYRYITYFINDSLKSEELENQVITGFCLSIGDMAFYIYEGELKC